MHQSGTQIAVLARTVFWNNAELQIQKDIHIFFGSSRPEIIRILAPSPFKRLGDRSLRLTDYFQVVFNHIHGSKETREVSMTDSSIFDSFPSAQNLKE